MKVMKFGGTSVGSADRMKEVASLVSDGDNNIVVLSAMSGTTNNLVEISNYLYKKNHDGANRIINQLEKKYYEEIDLLYKNSKIKEEATEVVKSRFDFIKSLVKDEFSEVEEKEILAQGELMSTAMVNLYLIEQGKDSVLIPALEFMKTNSDGEPDISYIKENIKKYLDIHKDSKILITQGYICRNVNDEIDNLQRGGSDYTASLIGAAVNADEIQIWTDIDGMHNNDPRYVENTKSIAELSFDEAAELAYFGAKILHPTSVLPAKVANVPVRVLNTMEPKAPGTTISGKDSKNRITAVAAKDGITAIRIHSGRMLMAYGFLRKVFEIFENHKTPIDMITTSEVGVSVTIDKLKHLDEIVDELKTFGSVEVDSDLVIICIVGDLVRENKGYANRIFDALKDIPLRMISYGGSDHNISVLVSSENKKEALRALSAKLF
ncbi:aspartate kinase [Alkalitalea saponilacus]|uniref:Aspartokinase n=1 Tax=Alkalitalea saponilacus TaxID=889453 RepID=A0A1T5AV78_9BACT|nr:aspartate kinase [Alkalitalea saponilacus]ASB48584.1 aspartate kinase [Alkalitalea saponilacus]SKB38875.1 aspartate kinase [Alkalitalea saponilacus]